MSENPLVFSLAIEVPENSCIREFPSVSLPLWMRMRSYPDFGEAAAAMAAFRITEPKTVHRILTVRQYANGIEPLVGFIAAYSERFPLISNELYLAQPVFRDLHDARAYVACERMRHSIPWNIYSVHSLPSTTQIEETHA